MLGLIAAMTLFAAALFAVGAIVIREAMQKHVGIWLGAYLVQQWRRSWPFNPSTLKGPTHILFCLVDHFEPISAGSTKEQERQRMHDWLERYPALASRHRDSDGRPPQHTWFYPAENYDPEYLDDLGRLCRQGLGEIELHLHHGNDTSASLREKIQKAISDFAKHGALMTQETPPRHVYGFIHGNMALDNSMNNPALCGVNDEITVLKDTGCYADFSLPTAPAVSQTRKVNAVYYASDDPRQPKSHDTGVDVQIGLPPSGDLMIIPGPLGFNWHNRKWGLIPRIENAEIQGSAPPTHERIRDWVRQHIHIKGRPDWVMIKVSCHGAEDQSRETLLSAVADEMYTVLEREYRDRAGYCLHYVTARELYNVIKAAESGMTGNPDKYRDYLLPRYQTHAESVRI
jgi:hypothetical protein